MAGVELTYVGLARTEPVADELERVAKMIRDGFREGELYEAGGGWWKIDGIDDDTDHEEDDDGPA